MICGPTSHQARMEIYGTEESIKKGVEEGIVDGSEEGIEEGCKEST